jgi:hypothetical protein
MWMIPSMRANVSVVRLLAERHACAPQINARLTVASAYVPLGRYKSGAWNLGEMP